MKNIAERWWKKVEIERGMWIRKYLVVVARACTLKRTLPHLQHLVVAVASSLAPDTELNVFITWNVRKFSRECHQIYIEIISSRKNYVIYQIIKTIRRKLAEQARKNCQKTKRQPINNYYKIIIKVLYKQ